MANDLVKLPSRRTSTDECQYNEDHMLPLITATNNVANEIKTLGSQITTLNNHHKDIIRYLMIVVCVIALGKSLLEAVESLFSKSPTNIVQSK